MGRLSWCILVSFTTILVQANSDRNVLDPFKLAPVNSLSGFALETILSKHDFLMHKFLVLRKDVQEQQKTATESQEQTLQVLVKMQEEMRQMRVKQEQSLEQSSKLQLEMRKQRKEIEKYRDEFAKWKAETGTTITAIRTEPSNWQKDVLGAITANRIQQKQGLELLNTLQQNVQQQKNDETNYHSEERNWHSESQNSTADIQRKQDRIVSALDTMSQKLFKMESTLSTHGSIRLEQLKQDNKQLLDINLGTYRSCKDVPIKVSGKYKIRASETSTPFFAYCEQNKTGGGWMVIQHRFDGKLNFDRNWTEYRNGFGEVDGEHWLGLERIHQMTEEQNCELLVELKDFYGNYQYAIYDSFGIEGEAEHYKLKTLGAYAGTADDSLRYHVDEKFSTTDRDNDKVDFNCAKAYGGGWWFYDCYKAFLNGLYRNVRGRDESKISWDTFSRDLRGLSYTRMMIRSSN